MFDAGPRQTIPLDATLKKAAPHDLRVLNWTAVRDETQDFELNTRNVFGGRGLIDDDRLFYLIGGFSSGGVFGADLDTIDQFQQATGAVTTTGDLSGGAALPMLPAGRRDFAVATLDDGRVYIIGGRSGAAPGTLVTGKDAVLEFDPRTNTLKSRSEKGFTPRHSFGAAAVLTSAGNRIYAVGGYGSTTGTDAPLATVEEFNPKTNQWRTVAPLATGVAQFGITVAGGINTAEPLQLIHVVSGNKGSENVPAILDSSALHAPVPKTDADAKAGRALFGQVGLVSTGLSCATCHGGKKWTRSLVDYEQPPSPDANLGLGNEKVIGAELRSTKSQPFTTDQMGVAIKQGVLNNVGTFLANAAGGRVNEIRFNGADVAQAIAPLGNNGFNIPSLLSVSETAPYFYNGLAQTLEEVLNCSLDGNNPNSLVPAVRVHFVSDAANRTKLIRFLRSIDERTPSFK